MEFKDKVCVVTGGANGIGKNIVKEFIKAGAKVCFIDMDKENGMKLCENYNDEILFFQGDISKEEVLNEFYKTVISKYEKIDYLINNACLTKGGILSGCTYDDFNYVFKIGVTAPYMLSKLFMEDFNENGSIVNISSTRAYMSQADTESYSAAKGGITALTHALSVSLAGKVRVNSISPGWIETEENMEHSQEDKLQHLVKRVGRVSDISNMVMFLCSEKSGFITGQDFTVDGGMSKLMIYNDDKGWSYRE